MSQQPDRASPQLYARTCGVMYLYIIAMGIFAELFVRSGLIVSKDAAATASNIASNEMLFRLGFSGELLHIAFDVIIAVLLYALLKPIDRTLALLAAFMRFACDIILAVTSLTHFTALQLYSDANYLNAFGTDQLHALALLVLKLHGDGYAISLVFFGFACLSLGYLIFRSGFLPKTIGALMGIAGLCYLITSFSQFLSPTLAGKLFPVLFVPMFVAELAFALWLIFRGVDVAKWREKAAILGT